MSKMVSVPEIPRKFLDKLRGCCQLNEGRSQLNV